MYVWWPGISNDIANTVRHCLECQQQPAPAVILIDAHSKWIEAVSTPQATSPAVMEELRPLFAKFGIPETIVSDNGTCFVSKCRV